MKAKAPTKAKKQVVKFCVEVPLPEGVSQKALKDFMTLWITSDPEVTLDLPNGLEMSKIKVKVMKDN